MHQFTAASKESIHIAILAKVLDEDPLAQLIYTKNEALDMLTKKIDTYEKFDKQYPGFGGFLPWLSVVDGVVTPTYDWTNRVPSLDNGELFWAMYGLVEILDVRYPHQKSLRNRWEKAVQRMIKNSIHIFYEGTGRIRTITKISDVSREVAFNYYSRWQSDQECADPSGACYLDDPYEGETFSVMMTLFAPFSSP